MANSQNESYKGGMHPLALLWFAAGPARLTQPEVPAQSAKIQSIGDA